MSDSLYGLVLERYSESQWFSDIRRYLDLYWLRESEGDESYRVVFSEDCNKRQWPAFNHDFAVAISSGGVVLSKVHYEHVVELMKMLGETEFFLRECYVPEVLNEIVADYRRKKDKGDVRAGDGYWPPVRFHYPTGTSYASITSGAALCTQPFILGNGNWVIYGSSGSWGIYIRNDEDAPVCLIGCNRYLVPKMRYLIHALINDDGFDMGYADYASSQLFQRLLTSVPEMYRERINKDSNLWTIS